jgi:hypothetical protein
MLTPESSAICEFLTHGLRWQKLRWVDRSQQ